MQGRRRGTNEMRRNKYKKENGISMEREGRNKKRNRGWKKK